MAQTNTMIDTICEVITGSQLHGTAGPKSDTDLKGIYRPNIRDLALVRAFRNIQAAERNMEVFSLQEFLRLACEGQTIALEMLHAPKVMTVVSSPVWDRLVKNRDRFSTKRAANFVAFAKTMADKYVTRGNRLMSINRVLEIFEACADKTAKIGTVWNRLPDAEFTFRSTDPRFNGVDKRAYMVCDRSFSAATPIRKVIESLGHIQRSFGERVQLVAEGDGKEVKSFSHAFRAGYQLTHLLKTGTIPFPLPEAPFLKAIKYGEISYDGLPEKLEQLLAEADALNARSDMPENVDQEWVNQFILDAYNL